MQAYPVKKVKFLDEDNHQTGVLTADEERLYLLAASQPLRDIAILMLDTGMRPGRGLPHAVRITDWPLAAPAVAFAAVWSGSSPRGVQRLGQSAAIVICHRA